VRPSTRLVSAACDWNQCRPQHRAPTNIQHRHEETVNARGLSHRSSSLQRFQFPSLDGCSNAANEYDALDLRRGNEAVNAGPMPHASSPRFRSSSSSLPPSPLPRPGVRPGRRPPSRSALCKAPAASATLFAVARRIRRVARRGVSAAGTQRAGLRRNAAGFRTSAHASDFRQPNTSWRLMVDQLRSLTGQERVLEIGTGLGYDAAVLGVTGRT